MRGKLMEVYTDCDKQTIDGILLIIIRKVVVEMEKGGPEQMLGAAVAAPSQDFSEDLWKTENHLEDAERILKKMNENDILPDILTTVLAHMYNKTGNLERAKEAFEGLRSQGFQPDVKDYRQPGKFDLSGVPSAPRGSCN
ncbi:hypothetical protein PVL29_015712 [Vitis rotundifolia]|uniref:Pentatricopeptide repeat-containing protein n=1 Tax=Vitis rotundifolia TaxID=103349 RepID=A0AA38ZDE9_VITRO|nr:hypothetical protein PVL29_015712 [Vitis rotundifolia]